LLNFCHVLRFRSAKAFASWLRLAPNNRISGGKVISSRTPKGSNKFALALRNAANTISNKKNGALVSFFKRIAYKKGRAAAITATARKLATIIYSMIIRQEEYRPMGSEQYQELIKLKRINSIRKMMKNSNILASELSMS
jgi:transposase